MHLIFQIFIKSIYGKNKKVAALDLDNTLWGGVIGDDGLEEIEIGHETSVGQAFSEFQKLSERNEIMGRYAVRKFKK